MTGTRAVVVGGGLAGIAAAVQLAGHGVAVTVVEARRRLGGRATSFEDPHRGRILDNCQHVLMGCCTNLIDLYRKLGVQGHIQWHRKLYFAGPQVAGLGLWADRRGDGEWIIDVLEADDLPAPLHMVQALMRFGTLKMAEKVAVARGMLKILRLGKAGRESLSDQSFLDWLVAQQQPAGAIEKFWALIIISALNELPQHASAAYAMQVFQDGFLANEQAYVMGLASVPLLRLYDPAQQVIEAAGGQVLLGARADRFEYQANGRRQAGRVAALHLADGTRLDGDLFVSALPFDRLGGVCDSSMCKADERLRRLERLSTSPILGVHLWFARPVMTHSHLILVQSPLQWIFNKGIVSADNTPTPETGDAAREAGQHIHGVISAAHQLVDLPAHEIVEMVLQEVRKALPDARRAEVIDARVIKEKRATFSVKPGVDRLRPPASGAISNLYLAGDFCRSGWPATMEGAVRSGYIAAAAALHEAGEEAEVLAPDLDRSGLYKFLVG